jgi:hypothetical protein
MRTHRFGRKIRLPSTIAIKHQLRTLMARDEVEKPATEARADVFRAPPPNEQELLVK